MSEVFTSAPALGTRVSRVRESYVFLRCTTRVMRFKSSRVVRLSEAYYESNKIRGVESTVKRTKLRLFENYMRVL